MPLVLSSLVSSRSGSDRGRHEPIETLRGIARAELWGPVGSPQRLFQDCEGLGGLLWREARDELVEFGDRIGPVLGVDRQQQGPVISFELAADVGFVLLDVAGGGGAVGVAELGLNFRG